MCSKDEWFSEFFQNNFASFVCIMCRSEKENCKIFQTKKKIKTKVGSPLKFNVIERRLLFCEIKIIISFEQFRIFFIKNRTMPVSVNVN